ncbi:hypothetical protein NM688_g2718 [Phlebia brevispora]|uniref:Uncharacterized protein n=1 Tax=Phlebia brevispora TaxID=194682 RepID=A0ACC1T7U2_9APHY|nr:hypothetical protein NM688_g2718 [Phlebia brevispora]
MRSTQVEHAGLLSRVDTPLGRANRVPIQFFLDRVLPPLCKDLEKLDSLINDGIFLDAIIARGNLWGYTKKTPSGIHRRDVNKAFASLQRDIRVMANRAPQDTEPTVIFYNNKEGESDFEEREDDSFPDAFFVSPETSRDAIQWSDIGIVGEYQREDGKKSLQENIKKVSQSMSNCIERDPRRRFVYAFTVEDATMRLWYCDRSQVVVSDPFNFVLDCRVLLHFVLAVSFAAVHQLGWDPTMVPLSIDGQTQYDITVRSEDGELVSDIFNTQYQASRKYFISVKAHGDVFIGDVQDRTPRLLDLVTSTRRTSPKGTSHASTTTTRFPVQMHYRIVYGEVGEPLSEVTSLYTVYRALMDAVYGLRAMHRAGWVHRDLSIGNILVVDGVGKIIDLEYATSNVRQSHPGRTGTANFVAVEVDCGCYIFRPSSLPSKPYEDHEFLYNPLHDLESLWWIAVYVAIKKEIERKDDEDSRRLWDTHRQAQREAAREFFYQRDRRHAALTYSQYFLKRIKRLHPTVAEIGLLLDDIRRALQTAYTKAERSIGAITFDMDAETYNQMCDWFGVAAEIAKDLNVHRFHDMEEESTWS